jgi:hypothetical protein
MGRFIKRLLILTATVVLGASGVEAATPVDSARQLFDKYQSLETSFDPAIVDLYADSAKIRNKHTMSNGQARNLSLPAPTYKALIRRSMPQSKAINDRSTYSNVSYRQEGKNVRITATRFSLLKKDSTPISWVVGPTKNGKWQILEEMSESRQ